MKRKAVVLLTILIAAIALTSCVRSNPLSDSYTIDKGREVFLSEEYFNYTIAEKIALPEGVFFESYLYDDTYLVYASNDSEKEAYLYGLANSEGLVVPCEYNKVSKSGLFLNFTKIEESGESINEIRYIDGILLLKISGSISIKAINEDYCALYYDSYSQVFDKDGVYYFTDSTKMSSNFSYSYCDGRLFGQDTLLNDWFVWTLSKQEGGSSAPTGIALIDTFFISNNEIKTVCYLGKDVYLVIESVESNKSEYTYYEEREGSDRFVFQHAYTVNLSNGQVEEVELEYPILGVLNKYSPSMSYEQRETFNVSEGYTAVCIAVLGEDLKRVGLRYYVIDSDCNFVIRYPEGITPGAISFIDGYGFTGMATASYGSGLYYMNCDVTWINQEHEYFDHSFNYGRYVCAYGTEKGSVYGAFDSEGNVVINFEYSYISPFSQDKAIAQKDDVYYLIDSEGEIIQNLEDFYEDITILSFGMYLYEDNGYLGIKNFAGNILVKAENNSYVSVEKHGSAIFACFEKNDASVLYKIY